MTSKKKKIIKKVIKTQIIVNPNTKFYFLVGSGIAFGVAGMALPPIGQIDWSILLLIGQLLILAAAIMGISVNFDLKRGILQSDCDNDDDDEENEKEQNQ